MRSRKMRRKMMVGLLTALGGATMLQSGNGCLNTLLSIPVCGVVLPDTVCTPEDQLLLTFRFLQVPDFGTDPSCTIPFGCSGPGNSSFPFGGGTPVNPQAGGTGGGGVGGAGGAGGGGGI